MEKLRIIKSEYNRAPIHSVQSKVTKSNRFKISPAVELRAIVEEIQDFKGKIQKIEFAKAITYTLACKASISYTREWEVLEWPAFIPGLNSFEDHGWGGDFEAVDTKTDGSLKRNVSKTVGCLWESWRIWRQEIVWILYKPSNSFWNYSRNYSLKRTDLNSEPCFSHFCGTL